MEFKADHNSLVKSLAKFMASERYGLILVERGCGSSLLRATKEHLKNFDKAYNLLPLKSIEAVDAINDYMTSKQYNLIMIERGIVSASAALQDYLKYTVSVNTPIDNLSPTNEPFLIAKKEFVQGYQYNIVKSERGAESANASIAQHIEQFAYFYDKAVVNPVEEPKVEPVAKAPGFFRGFFNRKETDKPTKIKP